MSSSYIPPELTPSQLMTANLYDVLGVPKEASPEDIRRAYKKQALKYHPDKVRDPTPEITEAFQRVKFAYDVLSDENKRATYDEFGERGVSMIDQAGPFAEFLNPQIIRLFNVFFLVLTILLILLLLFPVFVALKADGNVSWSWAAVFSPLWILDVVIMMILLTAPVREAAEVTQAEEEGVEDDRDLEELRKERKAKEIAARWTKWVAIIIMTLIILFEIFLVLKGDGVVSWLWAAVFAPYWILECVALFNSTRQFSDALEKGTESFEVKKDEETGEISEVGMGNRPLTGFERILTFYNSYRWTLCRLLTAILICLKLDGPLASTSWAVIFIPAYIPGVLEFISLFMAWVGVKHVKLPEGLEESHKEEIKSALSSLVTAKMIGFLIVAGLAYISIGLFVGRLVNGGISIAQVFIPVFIVLSLFILCSGICLPLGYKVARTAAEEELMGQEEQPMSEAEREAIAAQGGQGGYASRKPQIIPEERRIEG